MDRDAVQLDGVEMAYVRRGRGRPAVLLHGFPLDAEMWRPQIDELSKRCDVIAPDLRGFGHSQLAQGDAASGVAMSRYAADVAELLDVLEIKQPVVLAGFSMGGYVAWQFALAHPQRLAGLVAVDTRAVADTDEVRQNRLKMADETLAGGDASTTLGMLPKLLAPQTLASRPDLVNEVRAMMLRQAPAAIAAAQRGMAQRPDLRQDLGRIACPALAVAGANDAISSPDEIRAIARALPSGEFVEIPAAGHLSPLENPAAVNAALATFVAAVD